MSSNGVVRRRFGRGAMRLAHWLGMLVAAFGAGSPGVASSASDPPALVDGVRIDRDVPGDLEDRLVVDASAGALVVVVDQLGVDIVPRCASEAHARNAQTGRWGPEVILVEGICELTVRARSVGMPRMAFRARAFALDSKQGRRWPRRVWALWSQAHYDGGAENVQGNTDALTKLQEVERVVAGSGDSDELRYLRLGNAHLLRRTGQHTQAVLAYDAMVRGLDPARDSVWLTRASNGKGLSLRELDRFDEADRAFADAERYGADRRDAYEWVSAKNNRCLILHHYGRLAAARDCYAAVIPDYREVAPNQLAVPMLNLAAAADALGEPVLALKNYRAALDLRRAGTDRSSLGFVLLNLADHEARTGAWPDALEHSLEAQQVFEALGDRTRLAATLNLRGSIYAELREPKRAREYFDASLRAALESKDPSSIAMAKSALAVMETDDALAAAAHREAIGYLLQTRQAGFASQEWMMLAERLDAVHDEAGRDAALAACETLLQTNGSRAYRARAAMLRARVALSAGRLAEARVHVTAAISLREQIRETEGLAAARLLKARIERRAGEDAQALAGIEGALEQLKRAERLPSSPVLAANLYDRRIELLDEAMDILLGSGDVGAAAMGQAWTLKWKYARMPDAAAARPDDTAGRELLDELRLKVLLLSGAQTPGFSAVSKPSSPEVQTVIAKRVEDIESQLDARRAQPARANSAALALPAVQAALQPGDALISLSLGTRASGAWISDAHATRWIALPARAEVLRSTQAVLDRFDEPANAALSRAFAAVLAASRDARRVLIVPDGPSHLIPFAALRDEAGRYWIERSSIALLEGPPTAPSQLRPVTLGRDFPVVVWGAGQASGEPQLALTAVDTAYRSGAGLAKLPAASMEMHLMESVLGERRIVPGDPRALVAPSGVQRWMLHVVGHGLANTRHPYAAALALPGSGGDGGFTFLGGTQLELGAMPPNIVFVNVCEGYSGRLFDSQPPSSLARAFLQAGAEVVIAASWPIEDMRAARFAERLYEELDRDPADVAEALARAQRKALQSGGARSLRYWSGYSVVRGG